MRATPDTVRTEASVLRLSCFQLGMQCIVRWKVYRKADTDQVKWRKWTGPRIGWKPHLRNRWEEEWVRAVEDEGEYQTH